MSQQPVRRFPPAVPEANVTSLEALRPWQGPPPLTGWRWLWAVARGRGTAVTLLVLAAALALGGVLTRYDRWKTALGVRRELLDRYLLYQGFALKEYWIAYPLAADAQQELTYERYTSVLGAIHEVQQKRQEAFAHLQSQVVSLRAFPGENAGALEAALYQSDVRANKASGELEAWLRDTFCMHADCENSLGRVHDVDFPQYEALMRIRDELKENHDLDFQVEQLIEAGF